MSEYIDCYYARTRAGHEPRPYLDGIISVETAVVGGGLAGLTIALELAAARPFRRAAGRAPHRLGRLRAQRRILRAGLRRWDRWHRDKSRASRRRANCYAMSREAVTYVQGNLAAFGMPVDPARMGHISARRVPALRRSATPAR